jgi:hypothetical protein
MWNTLITISSRCFTWNSIQVSTVAPKNLLSSTVHPKPLAMFHVEQCPVFPPRLPQTS